MRYRRVYLEITPRCNLSCSFCVQKRIKREDLSYADFEKIGKALVICNYMDTHEEMLSELPETLTVKCNGDMEGTEKQIPTPVTGPE